MFEGDGFGRGQNEAGALIFVKVARGLRKWFEAAARVVQGRSNEAPWPVGCLRGRGQWREPHLERLWLRIGLIAVPVMVTKSKLVLPVRAFPGFMQA